MDVDYGPLILGDDVQLTETVKLHIPTIRELLRDGEVDFLLFTRVFVVGVREQYSGIPLEVDRIERDFPTMWEIAFDNDMNIATGNMMFGEGVDILSVIVGGLAYWTKSEADKFRILSNHKIVNEELDWIVDKEEFERLCQYIKMITLSEPDEDMIAPKGISSKQNQCRVWENLYKGRLRNRQKQPSKSLGDKLLIMEAYAPSYIPFREMEEMNYYQFTNLLRAYNKRRANDFNNQLFLSEKFDTKDMKLADLSDEIAMIKLNK